MKFLIILFFVGCSTSRQVSQVQKPLSWSERKRECHTHYLDRFGLKPDGAIGICKEELGRN